MTVVEKFESPIRTSSLYISNIYSASETKNTWTNSQINSFMTSWLHKMQKFKHFCIFIWLPNKWTNKKIDQTKGNVKWSRSSIFFLSSNWIEYNAFNLIANDFQTKKSLFLKNIIMVRLLFDFIANRKRGRKTTEKRSGRVSYNFDPNAIYVLVMFKLRIVNQTKWRPKLPLGMIAHKYIYFL